MVLRDVLFVMFPLAAVRVYSACRRVYSDIEFTSFLVNFSSFGVFPFLWDSHSFVVPCILIANLVTSYLKHFTASCALLY